MAKVIVRKSDNLVVDASEDESLTYNAADYENLIINPTPIAAGDQPQKYMKDGSGNIVKRPLADLIKQFEDEKTNAITAHLATIQDDPALLQATKDAIAGIIAALAG